MIVESKKSGANVVPYQNPSSGLVEGTITLLPGMNDIPKDKWEKARCNLKKDIDRGLLKEVATEVKEIQKEVKDKDGKKKTVTETKVVSKSIKDLTSNEAEAIIRQTYNLKTLRKWKNRETRDSVRLEITKQIEHIEKYGEDKKRKLEEEDGE